jgi:murein DD-endopeptidase MepM/ murein hydrolase activator NlpD
LLGELGGRGVDQTDRLRRTVSSGVGPSPGWQDRLPQYTYGPNYPAPKNPLGPNGTATVTQGFGVPWSNNPNDVHTGIDIAANKGSLVSATQGGVVKKIEWLGCKDGTNRCAPNSAESWGDYVLVQDPNGTVQSYLHVVPNSNLVLNSQIKAGDIVGTVYQDHLHYNNCQTVSDCWRGEVSPQEFQQGNFVEPQLQ